MTADPQPARRIQRDAWTRLVYLQLGAFSFFLYSFSPAIGFLKDDLHISAGLAGLHSTAYAVGVTLGGVTAPWYITRVGGSGRALWFGLLGLCAAVGLFCALPVLPLTLSAAIFCGVFGSYLCIAVPSALARTHGPEFGATAITEANGVAAVVGITAPFAIGGAVAAGIGWRPAMLAVVPLCAALFLLLGKVRESPRPTGNRGSETEGTGHDSGPEIRTDEPDGGWRTLPRRFWINQIAGVCVVAIEFSLTLWCASLLQERAGLNHGTAALGVSAIVAGLAVGRLIGGPLTLRIPMDRLLFTAFTVNGLGFALFWLAATPASMFAGLVLAGLGMSLEFPLVSARGINLSGGRPELAGAINMLGGGIAIGTAPFALGVLSDRIGVHAAYLLVPALIAIAIAALAASRPPHRPPHHRTLAVRASESMAT